MSGPAITVLVPVKDRRERMLRCLDALLALDHPSFEVIVLDNESSDGTPEACRERAQGSGVDVRVEVVAGSVGEVRNAGARLARGALLAYTDSDCLPTPGWLRAGAAPFADPRVGTVCGCTLPEEPFTQGWPASIEVRDFTGRYESCNVLFRRDAFLASDGFDEVVGHFWEDTAAGFAMRRGGWEARFAPDALVHHDVTYPGFWWALRRTQKNANVGRVIARYPEIRRELLWGRVFLHRRDALYLLGLAGVLASPRRPATLALGLPYLIERSPGMVAGRLRPRGFVQSLLFDGASILGAARGGLRARTPVL